jgi:hypothetical protein
MASKTTPAIVAVVAPSVTDAQVAAASAAIRGLTQDQIVALWHAGTLRELGAGALWLAYVARVDARQARKSRKSESEEDAA